MVDVGAGSVALFAVQLAAKLLESKDLQVRSCHSSLAVSRWDMYPVFGHSYSCLQ